LRRLENELETALKEEAQEAASLSVGELETMVRELDEWQAALPRNLRDVQPSESHFTPYLAPEVRCNKIRLGVLRTALETARQRESQHATAAYGQGFKYE
jgi:hypothetical protein